MNIIKKLHRSMIMYTKWKPRLRKNIYSDKLNEDYYFYYIPESCSGIVYIDGQLKNILDKCNGENSIEELGKIFNINIDELKLIFDKIESYGMFINAKHEYTNKPRKKETPQIDAWLHITNKCNLNCTYCYIKKTNESMPIELAKLYIDKMVEACKSINNGYISIRFAGGEPLLEINLIKSLIAYIEFNYPEYKFQYGIITNGILLKDEKIVKYLLEKNISVAVSLDGMEEYHNKTRIGASNSNPFQETIYGMQVAEKCGLVPNILTTVAPENLDGLTELTKYLSEKKLHFRYGLQKDLFNIPELVRINNQLSNIIQECISILEQEIMDGNNQFEFNFNDIQFEYPVRRSCSAGTVGFGAGHNGKVALCGMTLVNPFSEIKIDSDLRKIMEQHNKEISNFSINNIDECKICIWKYACAAGCPAQNKSLFGKYEHGTPYCEAIKKIVPKYIHMIALKQWSSYKK